MVHKSRRFKALRQGVRDMAPLGSVVSGTIRAMKTGLFDWQCRVRYTAVKGD